MQHDLDPRGLDYLVKGILLGNVGHNDNLQLACGRLSGVGGADGRGFLFGADGGDDAVALSEELFEDVRWERWVSFVALVRLLSVGVGIRMGCVGCDVLCGTTYQQ